MFSDSLALECLFPSLNVHEPPHPGVAWDDPASYFCQTCSLGEGLNQQSPWEEGRNRQRKRKERGRWKGREKGKGRGGETCRKGREEKVGRSEGKRKELRRREKQEVGGRERGMVNQHRIRHTVCSHVK